MSTIKMQEGITINKYLPITLLYFFLNSFLLPQGLLYTTLLTPFLLIWLYQYSIFSNLWLFFLLTLPFVLVHVLNGIEMVSYVKSYILLFSVFIFGLAFYLFLKKCQTLGPLFRSLAVINFLIVLIAIIVFFIPGIKDIFWYKNTITRGMSEVYRLKLLTYEASYYSLLLAPLVLFYYLKIILGMAYNRWLSFLIVTIPLLLSLSFGVLAALLMTLIFLFCSDIRLFTFHKKYPVYIIAGLLIVFLILSALALFSPDNVLFVRIGNIFQGYDSSFKGRTFDSLYLGWKLAAEKSIFFGCGPGQIKIIGLDIFNTFYKQRFIPGELAIPNSFGDTLAAFGILGAFTKLFLEIYFFFKTKVYTNFYRLSLFLFIFIYQFTGSFITNIAEYVIWILAFYSPLFPEFNKINFFENEGQQKGLAVNRHAVGT